MQKKYNVLGFTLVELIVVITIIGILATVGFVSYSSYLTGARDSNRISQMSQLSQSLQVYGTKKSLPLPDNYVEITAAVTTIAYQGELGVDVLEAIDYSNGGKDPKDDMYYSYYVPKSRNVFQLMALMEEQASVASLPLEKGVPAGGGIIPQSYAADYSERFPKVYGRKLGIMTDSENAPLERLGLTSLDVIDANATIPYISYISEDDIITGDTSSALTAIIPNASCKRIKQTGGGNSSGTYAINPIGAENIQVYCEMEVAGGGWTEVASSTDGASVNIPEGISYSQAMIYAPSTGKSEVEAKNPLTDPVSPMVGVYTLSASGITGGAANDGLNGEQGKVFVK